MNEINLKGYGYKMKKLREEKDLTRVELAKKLNVSVASISSYEKEERRPRDEIKIKICEFFNVNIKDIFF